MREDPLRAQYPCTCAAWAPDGTSCDGCRRNAIVARVRDLRDDFDSLPPALRGVAMQGIELLLVEPPPSIETIAAWIARALTAGMPADATDYLAQAVECRRVP